ncbi:Gfo/Idh/MocA family protein [Ferruginivarius sediminum]|uniref:Gfo/Idh/MocA family oxidoreductase n=1 Tax=Ferruginivarius sediminum TaxID=2661937 RepID=A0A369T7I2_9PROT|nr:Gfo/Idh/MocA family oxidoreductase [Ferruginivarius sediminum]RDD60137.1 gfo/Idh/MocA family oxidoreductase [Ferruginivarius sediminum]
MRVAIIGCGKQAPKHIAGYRAAGVDIEPVLADLDEARARALAQAEQAEWSGDPKTLIGDRSIEAVHICTPTASHYNLIVTALEAGKHVFCEKPLCQTVGEAHNLAIRAGAKGLVGAVGYIYRFVPAFEWLHGLLNLEDGAPLGRPYFGIFRIGGRGSHQPWKHSVSGGGGARNEMMVHMLDLVLWCFGDLRNIQVLREGLLRPRRTIQGHSIAADAEDLVVLSATTSGGAELLLEADLLTPAFSQFAEVEGDNGSFFGSIQPHLPSFVFLERAVGELHAGRNELKHGGQSPFARQMAAFAEAVRRGPTGNLATFESSVALMETVSRLTGAVSGED